jgi:hypothetical protein
LPSSNQPDRERTTAYRDSSGPISRSDAYCATIVGDWQEPSGECRLNTLTERADLDPETARAVAEAVEQRIAQPGGPAPRKGGLASGTKKGPGKANGKAGPKGAPTPLERAVALHRDEKLDEDEIAEALGRGDRAFVMASLAVRAGVQVAMVEQVVSTHSAKGVVSLAWKAGLSTRMATQLQMRLAGIAPRKILQPASGDRYPMTEEDMEWQLEFFRGLGSR